ncbi:hypothetical protein Ndes2526B_g05309 [Nannochloris sp. 'desiccata']|nr:hypothetical protein KSW81_006332 [Chlorella desiccata (nom. nud.)]KAG7674573.1 hypothetical protein KSW81_000222 [Chlorella desiccata (nom. nud.)]KAH7620059.1 hypothetical protein NADE_008334 [Chlorella desiccata (nom. nud.)]
MASLVFKVVTLTVKTVAKPLAGQFEKYVMGHPVLRSKVISLAQFIHRVDVRITRGAEGKTGRAFVGDMSEERAVQLASKVASEGFLYSTAIALILIEMERKSVEESEKKRKQLEEAARITALHERHIEQEKSLKADQDQMNQILSRLEERLLMMEEQIMDIRKSQTRRWFGFV